MSSEMYRGGVRAGRTGRHAASFAGALVLALSCFASTASASLISVGEGKGLLPGTPPVTVQTPAVAGIPPVEAGVGPNGVSVTTPVTPPVQVTPPPGEATTPVVTVPRQGEEVVHSVEGTVGGSGSGGSSSGGPSGSSTAARTATPPSAGRQDAAPQTTARGAARVRRVATGHARRAHARSAALSQGSGPAAAARPTTVAAHPAPAPKAAGGTGAAARYSRGGGDPLAELGESLHLPLPVPDWSKPIILLLALLALALAARSQLASRRARRLERRQGMLLRDIETMQAALVPEVPARLGGLAVSVAYRPAEGPAAGGDFYDVFGLDGERVAAIVGDVAGHGHEALRHAALARYTLRAFLKETGDPRETLRLAGHALSEPGVEQLATVAVGLFDTERGTLTYALAGHPPPILIGTGASDAPAHCSSPPLGCDMPTGRRQRTVSLPEGARACMFSDGLIEARRTLGGRGHPDLLGRARLAELIAALPPEAGAGELLAAVRDEAAATPDDMAACILTSETAATGAPVDLEELEVDAHALSAGNLAAYLRDSGLGETQAERVLRACRNQLSSRETALVAVDRAGGEPEVRVRPGRERQAGARRRLASGPTALQRV